MALIVLTLLATLAIPLQTQTPDRGDPHENERERDRHALDDALLRAARNGDSRGLEAALKKGADVNARVVLPDAQSDEEREARGNWDEEAGGTPIVLAAAAGHTATVERLLKAGAEIDAVDERGWSALMRAAYFGNTDTVLALIRSGAAVDTREKDGGATALHFAARQSRPETVKMLLEAGADPNSPLQNGWTPLMWAVERGDGESVRLLLDAGANPDAVTMNGITARQWAERRGDAQILALLGGKSRD
jgi:uncharacterized protein